MVNIEIFGFNITSKGDPSVGINNSLWELKNNFYFDDEEELEYFRKQLINIFNEYCGYNIIVETFEETSKRIQNEDKAYYSQYPVRYLIKDNEIGCDIYKQKDYTAAYSSDVGTAIHYEVYDWIINNSSDYSIIESTDPKFKKILIKEKGRLEHEIADYEYKLKKSKFNLSLIETELKYGK